MGIHQRLIKLDTTSALVREKLTKDHPVTVYTRQVNGNSQFFGSQIDLQKTDNEISSAFGVVAVGEQKIHVWGEFVAGQGLYLGLPASNDRYVEVTKDVVPAFEIVSTDTDHLAGKGVVYPPTAASMRRRGGQVHDTLDGFWVHWGRGYRADWYPRDTDEGKRESAFRMYVGDYDPKSPGDEVVLVTHNPRTNKDDVNVFGVTQEAKTE